MDIKGFLYQKKENRQRRWWGVLVGMIVLCFLSLIITLNKKQPTKFDDYFIGQKISFSGLLSYDDNFPTNTHKISNGTESFGLKESRINLNNFVDENVVIDGNISEITVKYPILVVSSIKIPEYKLSISENKFFYTHDLISFDFSKDIDVYSKQIGGEIVVYYQGRPLLHVKTFICSNITESQNCEKMKESHIYNPTESFESVLGNTFYRNKENSWIAFNDDNIGYIFTVENDDDLLNISHLINIVDSKFLSSFKSDFILSGCSNDEFKLSKISTLNKKIIDDNLIRLEVSGITYDKKNILCKLNVNIFNNWEITNVSISEK